MKRRSHEGSFGKPDTDPVKVTKRCEKWQSRLSHLGIGHWRIIRVQFVDEVPGSPNGQAAARIPPNYDSVEFFFKWDFLESVDHYELDCAIVHEWLHVAMRDFDGALEAVESWMPEKTHEDFEETVNHEREGLVERLARTIVGLYYDTDR